MVLTILFSTGASNYHGENQTFSNFLYFKLFLNIATEKEIKRPKINLSLKSNKTEPSLANTLHYFHYQANNCCAYTCYATEKETGSNDQNWTN